jgi:GntR family transcriptional regulator
MGLSPSDLDRAGPTPIFTQIRNRLETAIVDGAIAPHQRIPSERELSEWFGVSRMTVRQALDGLTADQLLYSLPGRGTFVASHRVIEQPLRHLSSFTDEMRARGLRPSSRLLQSTTMPATFELARLFDLLPNEEIVIITRLRLADDEPIGTEQVHIPARYVPGLLDKDLAAQSLYQVLRDEYGLVLVSGRQVMEAGMPSTEEQEVLGMELPTPVLRIARETRDEQRRVVEYVRGIYRGDRYHLTVELGFPARSSKPGR